MASQQVLNLFKRAIVVNRSSALHQYATRSLSSSSPLSTGPAMRFIQFQRRSAGDSTSSCSTTTNGSSSSSSHLGLLSADGRQLVDLTAQCPHLKDLNAFIAGGDAAIEKITAKLPAFEWQPLTAEVVLLPPVTRPEKIICIGLNYLGHCKEQNREAPTEPMFFSKFNNTLVGPHGDVIHHKATTQLDWEVELAVIIGKVARDVPVASAMEHVFGYTVAQDISARDWQKQRNGGQFLLGKSMDTFCPLGPAVVHKSLVADPHKLRIQCSVNGAAKQDGNTDELIYRIDQIVHLLSQTITLQPGDVILTGTPGGVGMHRQPAEFLRVGDVIESEIESIGKIRNCVVADN